MLSAIVAGRKECGMSEGVHRLVAVCSSPGNPDQWFKPEGYREGLALKPWFVSRKIPTRGHTNTWGTCQIRLGCHAR